MLLCCCVPRPMSTSSLPLVRAQMCTSAHLLHHHAGDHANRSRSSRYIVHCCISPAFSSFAFIHTYRIWQMASQRSSPLQIPRVLFVRIYACLTILLTPRHSHPDPNRYLSTRLHRKPHTCRCVCSLNLNLHGLPTLPT